MKKQPRLPDLVATIFAAMFILSALPSALALSGQSEPDYVLINGRVFTADAAHPHAEALAIQGERIIAVGSSEEISRLKSARSLVIDLGGRVVIPGINDAHYHFLPRPAAYQLALKEQEPT